MYDVIVVGTGAAGSSVGMLLARRGHRVLVVGRARVPSDTSCSQTIAWPGIVLLRRWNLLEPLLAAGCRSAETTAVVTGSNIVTLPEPSLVAERSLLDAVLLDAIRQAGAEVREGFTVKDIVWHGDRVSGVVGSTADERTVCERARVVIGADGRRSLVARALATPIVRDEHSVTCCFCACWRGLEARSPELFMTGRAAVIILPVHEQLAGVVVALPIEEWVRYKRAPEATYLGALADSPFLRERFAAATRESRFVGTGDLGSCVRASSGPAWALVGDASRHGGLFAPGISHAFMQAELLARTIDAGLSGGPTGLDDALTAHEARCDELLTEVEQLTWELEPWRARMDDLPTLFEKVGQARERQVQLLETFHSMGARGSGA